MARTAADVALLHSAITGQTVPPVVLKGTCIGIPRSHYWENLDDDVRVVAEAALARLRDAGAILVDIEVADFVASAQAVFQTLLANGFRGDLAIYFDRHAPQYDAADVIARIESRDTRGLFAMARDTQFPPGAVAAARTTLRAKIQAQYADILRAHGLAAVAFPTEPLTAPLIPAGGDRFEDIVDVAGKPTNKVLALIRNTGITCALGVPGISLPAGLTAAGLPVGLELDGWAGGDAALLGLSMAVEAAIGRIPPPALAAAPSGP
jgi:mandelamide amidase